VELQAPEGISVVVGPAELVEDPQAATFVDTRPVAAAAVVVPGPVVTCVVALDQGVISIAIPVPVAALDVAASAADRAVPVATVVVLVPVVTVSVAVVVAGGSDGGYGA